MYILLERQLAFEPDCNQESILSKLYQDLNMQMNQKSGLSEILLTHKANSVVYNTQWTYFTNQLTLLQIFIVWILVHLTDRINFSGVVVRFWNYSDFAYLIFFVIR